MRVGGLVSGILVSAFLFTGSVEAKESTMREVQIRDISTIEGVRENSLIGYGMVVGLNGTGDRQQTFFSTQTLANILRKMGVQINPLIIRVNNIAAVFVTATLPPFARPGTRIDVSVASIGDAKSLAGGTLLLTSLYGPDGQGYATAQGPLVLGAYTAGGRGNSVQMNHPTSGRIPAGAIVERAVPFDLSRMGKISLLLRDEHFSEAQDVAAAINRNLGKDLARA